MFAAAIAIVEDDEEIRNLLAGFLGREGFAVRAAESGASLDNLMSEGFAPDLLILDWMLPGEDGLSICRRLHAAGGPPIIMLTAKDEDIDRVLGLEIGADDYVAKPFNPRIGAGLSWIAPRTWRRPPPSSTASSQPSRRRCRHSCARSAAT